MKRPHPTIALLLWLSASYLASYIGTQGTLRGIMTIYPGLVKPAWNPPAWLFAPVWTVLYALIGLAAWRVWRAEGKGLWLWWVQLALNAAWPWLFFGYGKLGWAFGEIVVLWFTILATTLVFAKSDRRAAWLLVPYLAWVGFASILNLTIWRLNVDTDAKRVAAGSVPARGPSTSTYVPIKTPRAGTEPAATRFAFLTEPS